jgi:Amt family ammonium transporter
LNSNFPRTTDSGTSPALRRWAKLGLIASAMVLAGCTGGPTEHLTAEAVSGPDTAFVLVAAALVMFMTPGLALFYGGLVRQKNVLSIFMQCFVALAVVSITWVTIGYSLAFSPSAITYTSGDTTYGFIGSLQWAGPGLRDVGLTPHSYYAPTIPHRLFMIYQCMFAVITPALIIGAFAERMKFSTYLVFSVLWLLAVYCPVAHWVWSQNGWLMKIGSLDFAGGAVVHMTSGFTALVVAIMIKPRRGFPREAFLPHDLVLCAAGAGILWFGWFGFNAGSAVGVSAVTVSAFIATHLGAAGGALAWLLWDWISKGKPTVLGAASGAVAGLVAITPASGFVGPFSAIAIGLAAGLICSIAVTARAKAGVDDALDAFGVHGIGGLLGALLTGVFASNYINSIVAEGNQGLIFGDTGLIVAQVIGSAATILYTVVVSVILLFILDLTMGLRVTTEDEQMGLDLTQHGEAAYSN